jgi:hypothetical protein
LDSDNAQDEDDSEDSEASLELEDVEDLDEDLQTAITASINSTKTNNAVSETSLQDL